MAMAGLIVLICLGLAAGACTSPEAEPSAVEKVLQKSPDKPKTTRRATPRKSRRQRSAKRRRSGKAEKKDDFFSDFDTPELGEIEADLPEIASFEELEQEVAKAHAQEKAESETKRRLLEEARIRERERAAAEHKAKGYAPDMRYMTPEELSEYLRRKEAVRRKRLGLPPEGEADEEDEAEDGSDQSETQSEPSP